MPVLVGGTGFYFRALMEGLFPGPVRDQALRERLHRREGNRAGSLHRILSRLDPMAAGRIHPNDVNKTIRALEVRLLAGQSMSALFSQGRAPLVGFQTVKLGLNPPRDLLYSRLDDRTAAMFRSGLLDAVRGLVSRGVPLDAKPFESLGYKQALQVLEGRLTPDHAVRETQLETRRYAKRQLTWFRKEQAVHWLEGFGDDPAIQQQALAIIDRSRVETNL